MPVITNDGQFFFIIGKTFTFAEKKTKMRKSTILCMLLACLTGCHNSNQETSIQGEIKGLENDTLYLYGTDGSYEQMDTIIAPNGKIDYTLKVDTITSMMLLLNNRTVQVPLFLDKKEKITIQGNANAIDFLTLGGNSANEEYTAFQQALKGLGKPSDKVLEEKAEDFIRNHHSSLVSIYLLNKYFVQKETPDYAKINSLIELMAGNLQDNPAIEQIRTYAEQVEKVTVGRSAPYFSLPNAKGEKITRTGQFKDKYLLINFWASWNEQSLGLNAQLRKIYRDNKKNKKFGMLGISLDIDKEAWEEAIKRDTLNWEQVCDFTGLNAETVTQYAVLTLPVNVLIDPNGNIVARGIQGDSLVNKLKEVLKTAEEKKATKKKNR